MLKQLCNDMLYLHHQRTFTVDTSDTKWINSHGIIHGSRIDEMQRHTLTFASVRRPASPKRDVFHDRQFPANPTVWMEGVISFIPGRIRRSSLKTMRQLPSQTRSRFTLAVDTPRPPTWSQSEVQSHNNNTKTIRQSLVTNRHVLSVVTKVAPACYAFYGDDYASIEPLATRLLWKASISDTPVELVTQFCSSLIHFSLASFVSFYLLWLPKVHWNNKLSFCIQCHQHGACADRGLAHVDELTKANMQLLQDEYGAKQI